MLTHGCVYMDVCVCSGLDEIPTPSEPIEPGPRNRLCPHIIAVLLLSVIIFWQFAVVRSSWGCCHSCFDFITLQSFYIFGLSHLLIAVVDNDIKIVDMGPVPLSTPPNVLFIYFLYVLLLKSNRN